jgi:hypothetical protein
MAFQSSTTASAEEKIPISSPVADFDNEAPAPQYVLSLSNLPSKVIDQISLSLDSVSARCLSVTCRRLRKLVVIGDDKLTQCAKWLVMCRFELDSKTKQPRSISKEKSSQQDDAKLTCALCKTRQSLSRFEGDTIPNGFQHLHMLRRGSFSRLCQSHVPKTLLGRFIPSEGDNIYHGSIDYIRTRWECRKRPMCLHCGTIQAPEADDQLTCSCSCEFCPKDALVPTFARHGPLGKEKVVQEQQKKKKWSLFSRTKKGVELESDRPARLSVFFDRFECANDGPLYAVEHTCQKGSVGTFDAKKHVLVRSIVEFR